MKIKSAEFVISNTNHKLCPKPTLPEYAFIGRSNVGKSSLINTLTAKKNLAKTSSKPGKTQLINHFLINESWFLVDLPGYGYATVSRKKREEFNHMIKQYLYHRYNLICLFVLLDIRIEPQKIDLEFMQEIGEKRLPFVMIFTKCDKVHNNQIKKNIEDYKRKMMDSWESLPEIFISSAKEKKGMKEILSFIEKNNVKFNPI